MKQFRKANLVKRGYVHSRANPLCSLQNKTFKLKQKRTIYKINNIAIYLQLKNNTTIVKNNDMMKCSPFVWY